MKGKYDYSKFVYVNSKIKGIIICPQHGEFSQSPDNHINNKRGCPKCSGRGITKDICIKEAQKYERKVDWLRNSQKTYLAAHRNGWFNECINHMLIREKTNEYWTLEKCKEDALKYKTKFEWQKNSTSAYNKAQRMRWIKKCSKHMIKTSLPNGYWTLERCKEDALKYKTKKEWRENSVSAYGIAWKNRWFDECCDHMILKRKLTKEICVADALKYKRSSDWLKYSGAAYKKAKINQWNECFQHFLNLNESNII